MDKMLCPVCSTYYLEKVSDCFVRCPSCNASFLESEVREGLTIEEVKRMAEQWEERAGGAFWKPEKEGDAVEGVLTKIRTGQYGDIYDIEQKDGTVVTIPTSAVLANRLSTSDEGKTIRIVFDGLQQSKIKGRNPTRLFKVFFKK